jgi:peroxiredoxin
VVRLVRLGTWLVGLILVGGLGVLVMGGIPLSSAGSIWGSIRGAGAQGAVAGQLAPNFVLSTLSGKTVTLSQFRGKEPVYLNFWTTWCTYCKHEVPQIEAMQHRYGSRIAFLGVDLAGEETSLRAVRQFQSNYHVNYPILLDTTGQVADNYLVHSIPTTVVINRQGVVTAVFQGEATPGEMAAAIHTVLGGQAQ